MNFYHALARRFEPWKTPIRRVSGAVRIARALRFCLDGQFRAECILRRLGRPDVYQIASFTKCDRYPKAFAALARAMEVRHSPRILSFGCSTGEEISSLRALMPQSAFVGIDVNSYNVKRARTLLGPDVLLLNDSSIGLEARPPFDAIVCMAVLQRSELNHQQPISCKPLLTFECFEKAISDFDRNLKTGGYLLLHHTNFRFSETRVFGRYLPAHDLMAVQPQTAKYDRNNRLVLHPEAEPILYCKMTS